MTGSQDLIRRELGGAARPCVTCSFQAECVVLLHMIRQERPDIPVLFLDTFHHFAQVIAYRDRLAGEWGLNLRTLAASEPAVGLWRESFDSCCARHKVGPLFAALEGYDAWFTGLRRDQSPSRANLAHHESFRLPSGRSVRKLNPLAEWSMHDVERYAQTHDIPLLPLYQDGYLSIGCEPCTSLPVARTDPRSGRWAGQKLECGIHIPASATERDC